jgi:hypothetical protein
MEASAQPSSSKPEHAGWSSMRSFIGKAGRL